MSTETATKTVKTTKQNTEKAPTQDVSVASVSKSDSIVMEMLGAKDLSDKRKVHVTLRRLADPKPIPAYQSDGFDPYTQRFTGTDEATAKVTLPMPSISIDAQSQVWGYIDPKTDEVHLLPWDTKDEQGRGGVVLTRFNSKVDSPSLKVQNKDGIQPTVDDLFLELLPGLNEYTLNSKKAEYLVKYTSYNKSNPAADPSVTKKFEVFRPHNNTETIREQIESRRETEDMVMDSINNPELARVLAQVLGIDPNISPDTLANKLMNELNKDTQVFIDRTDSYRRTVRQSITDAVAYEIVKLEEGSKTNAVKAKIHGNWTELVSIPKSIKINSLATYFEANILKPEFHKAYREIAVSTATQKSKQKF